MPESTGEIVEIGGRDVLTYGEMFTVQPFGNSLVVKTLTGAQIRALLEQRGRAVVGGACHLDRRHRGRPRRLDRHGVALRIERDGVALHTRIERMNAVNPKYVPRNYLAQQAIDAMERGDASVLERLMQVLARPYDEQSAHDDLAARRPEWARTKAGCSALSCSS